MVIPGLKLPAIVIISGLMLAIGYDGIHFLNERRFNDALDAGDIAGVDGPDIAHWQFAKAYGLREQQDFKATVKAYATIDARARSQMQMDIKFNLANLYFREATQMRGNGANDLAMPLVELAKQNYKEILRIDNSHWDAKYNLELALFVAPETDPADALEERNPERSPRALTKIQSREPLP